MVQQVIIDIAKKIYALSGAEVTLFKQGLQSVEDTLGRQLDPIDDSDIIQRYLAEIGVSRAGNDLKDITEKYGEQLVWEGKEFKSNGKLKSGLSILKSLRFGNRSSKEGD